MISRQKLHGGTVFGVVSGIYLIHGSKITDVTQQTGRFYDMIESISGFFQNVAYIFQCLFGLFFDTAFGKLPGGRVDRKLTADIKCTVDFYCLAIGARWLSVLSES